MSREFSPGLIKRIDAVKTRYPSPKAALLPVLHLVQSETGFIAADEERKVASILGIPAIKVREVVTFYTMFTRKPLGRFHLQVCSNLSCSLAAGERIFEHLQAKLGVYAHRRGVPGGLRTSPLHDDQFRLSREPRPGEGRSDPE
jgi:NADH-quinone oxidoreductase subunit E